MSRTTTIPSSRDRKIEARIRAGSVRYPARISRPQASAKRAGVFAVSRLSSVSPIPRRNSLAPRSSSPRSGPRLTRRCFDRAVLRCAPIRDGRSLRLASLIGLAGGPVEGAPLGRRAGAVPLLVDRHMPAVLVALAVAVAADAIGADRADYARQRRRGRPAR